VRAVPVLGSQGIVEPSVESINNGSYAPLSRPIFIYVNKVALERPEVTSFVDYYLETAPRLAGEVGYIALPESVYQGAKDRLAQKVSGSAYLANSTLSKLVGQ